MNKSLSTILVLFCLTLLLAACSNKDPRKKGVAAGKAACQCYQLNDSTAIQNCLKDIEKENTPFLYDTIYINAMENELLNCISEGVIDFSKPLI